ncbi:hypothetical protein GOODEAATRI_029190 [Goodea atripinnis]|uniref:Uncharacterized protein n=1 Tax=Goodea atripinnis TaxID=208336 RepID=A0ABV0MLP3_9TELE
MSRQPVSSSHIRSECIFFKSICAPVLSTLLYTFGVHIYGQLCFYFLFFTFCVWRSRDRPCSNFLHQRDQLLALGSSTVTPSTEWSDIPHELRRKRDIGSPPASGVQNLYPIHHHRDPFPTKRKNWQP